jgi:type II secretory pathway pseudopilin PulG
MTAVRPAFTLRETAAVLLVVAVSAALMAPAARGSRRDGGLAGSLSNMRLIMEACSAYRVDHNRVPMRGSRYQNGLMGGWDGWNYGGKNCNAFWQTYTAGLFDESAYSRTLNSYLYPDVGVPQPVGYINTGSAPNWSFRPGTPSLNDRAALQLPVYRSPGDNRTVSRNWPTVVPGVSGYDDVGTSYLLNMKWWDMPGLPTTFTAKYEFGVGLIHTQAPPHYIWIGDQVLDLVPLLPSTYQIEGEFGGTNFTVAGFLDGRSEYIQLLAGASSGPGYTLFPRMRSSGAAPPTITAPKQR